LKLPVTRSLAVLAFAFVLSSAPSLPSFEARSAYSLADLESQAAGSLNDAYTLLINPAVDTSRLKLVGTVNEGDHATVGVAGRIAEISRFRAAAAGYGTRVTGAKTTLVDAKVESRGTQLVLRAIEDTVLSFEVGDRGPRPEDVTRQRIPHEFIFDPIGGGWVLVFDRPAWPQSNGGGTPAPKPAQPLLADRRSNDSPGGMKVLAKPVGAWGTYQWLDAVYYAHTYAFSYNSAYIAYVQDCTNFMSQALRGGGWTLTSMSSSTDPNLWWYDDTYDQNSQTWSAADWLINFVYSSGRGYSLSAFTDLVLGDLMFADWAYNGTPGVPEHAMMLTYKTSNDYGDIRFTYHTTDRYDYPLSMILASNPTPSNLYWGSRIVYTTN
jgi:hypothetical protein